MRLFQLAMFGSDFYIGFGIGMVISAGIVTWYTFGYELKQTMKGWRQHSHNDRRRH
jgi:hypothetical protein